MDNRKKHGTNPKTGTDSYMSERIKKDLILSNEVHSSLFLIKGQLQKQTGKNITLNEVVKVLLSHYALVYKLEEKE